MANTFRGDGILLPALILFCVTGLLYGPFLQNPYVFDDLNVYNNGVPRLYGASFSPFSLRSLPYSSLAWTYEVFGPGTAWPRLGNVLIHSINAMVLFLLLRRLLNTQLLATIDNFPNRGFQTHWAAFFSALFFALHPIAVYATGYLVQRTILMATLFSLLMWLTLLHGLRNKPGIWFSISAIFYFLAILSKEHSVMAPVIALTIVFLFETNWRGLTKQLTVYFLACTAIGIFAILSVKGMLGTVYEPYANEFLTDTELLNVDDVYIRSVGTQTLLFFKYLFLWAVPYPGWMSVDMRAPFADQILSWPTLGGLILFIGVPLVAGWLMTQGRQKSICGLAMIIPWIQFIPELSVVRIQEPFVLYRSYLWMSGLFIAMPLALKLLKPNVMIILSLIVSIFLFGAAFDRLSTFSHPLLLWDDAASLVAKQENVLGADRIFYNRAAAYQSLKLNNEALADYNKVIEINPKISQVYNNRGYILYEQEDYISALQAFSKAVELKPNYANAYYGKALCYSAMNMRIAAIENFRQSCNLGLSAGCTYMGKLK